MKSKITALALSFAVLTSNVAQAGYGHEGKMYTKIDFGFGIQDHKQNITGAQTGGAEDSGNGLLFNAALGHYFLDELRLDFQLHFDQGIESKKSFVSGANTVSLKGKEQTIGAFANVYYDWLNASSITPYVTAGVGLTRNEFTTKIRVNNGAENRDKKSKYGVGYKAGIGMAYHAGSNVDIDFGYNYLTKGVEDYSFTIPTANVNVKAETDAVHSLMVGIRLTY